MKLFLCLSILFVVPQIKGADPAGVPITQGKAPAYAVKERGPNSRLWETIQYETHDGHQIPHIHQVTELATGMHYLKDGVWTESQENIQALPQGGAEATEGQHQVYFPADIYNGVIEVVTPDGLHLKSRPIGISYFDGQNSVLIAELKSSLGQLVSSNQVIYPDAFTDFKADLVCTYRKSGFECDLVFREQPPGPDKYNLDPQISRLELWTEFFDTPEPQETVQPNDTDDGLTDTSLAFGQLQMIQGKAFSTGIDSLIPGQPPISVYKNWEQVDGRAILIEQVAYLKMSAELQALPSATGLAAVNKPASRLRQMAGKRQFPPLRIAQTTPSKMMHLAISKSKSSKGVVLDYTTIVSDQTNYTFQGDTTYYISAPYHLSGTTTFEGGSIIKFNHSGSIYISTTGTINCKTAAYRPAVFTSLNDESVGESIGGSSGTPAVGDAYVFLNVGPANTYLHDLRFCYGTVGAFLGTLSGTWVLENCQFYQLNIACEANNLWLRNVLIADVNSNYPSLYFAGTSVRAEHVTDDNPASNGGYFVASYFGGATISLTNCLVTQLGLVDPSKVNTVRTQNVTCVTSATGVYQTVGNGNYYLATNIYRNAGTTNIDPIVSANIQKRTTYPPILYVGNAFSAATNFSPQVQRDVDTPDLGYHYDALDYLFNGSSATANIGVSAGTAFGWYGNGTGYGLALDEDNILMTFSGTVISPCIEAGITTVQEGRTYTTRFASGGVVGNAEDDGQFYAPHVQAQFLKAYGMADADFFHDYSTTIVLDFNNSEFFSGSLGGYSMEKRLTNCLVDRTVIAAQSASTSAVIMRNCTMIGSYILTARWGTWPVWIQNCAFDGTDFSSVDDPSGGDTNITYCNYNAYLTNASSLLPIVGLNDVYVIGGFNWQTSTLGSFYEPTNSPLTNAGSMTADLLGLYHYTTQTNQTKEANSQVDIGYHYVAVDAVGNPIDSNADGIPDYLQDVNGNGIVDTGESSYGITINNPMNGSTIGN